MKIIRQRNGYDCGICCLAMLLGKSYEWVLRRAPEYRKEARKKGDDHDGLTIAEEDHILSNLGLDPFRALTGQVNQKDLRFFLKGRHALLTVHIINEPGSLHGVYWDGSRVFDPSRLKKFPDVITRYDEVCLVSEHKLFRWRMKNSDF